MCLFFRREDWGVWVPVYETETQLEHDRPSLTLGFPEIRAPCVGIYQWEIPSLERSLVKLTYHMIYYISVVFLRHVVSVSLVCFQAVPWHQPGGVWWWRSLRNYRRLWDWTQLWLWSLREGEAASSFHWYFPHLLRCVSHMSTWKLVYNIYIYINFIGQL